jgi:hypothetical protein
MAGNLFTRFSFYWTKHVIETKKFIFQIKSTLKVRNILTLFDCVFVGQRKLTLLHFAFCACSSKNEHLNFESINNQSTNQKRYVR